MEFTLHNRSQASVVISVMDVNDNDLPGWTWERVAVGENKQIVSRYISSDIYISQTINKTHGNTKNPATNAAGIVAGSYEVSQPTKGTLELRVIGGNILPKVDKKIVYSRVNTPLPKPPDPPAKRLKKEEGGDDAAAAAGSADASAAAAAPADAAAADAPKAAGADAPPPPPQNGNGAAATPVAAEPMEAEGAAR